MAKKTPTKFSFFSSHLYSLLTITITLSLIPSQIHSSTHQDDIHSLQEIKNAIDPNSVSSSSYINSWDFTVDPCQSTGPQFLGILCDLPLDNSSSRVTAIDLDGIGYEGFLTPAIGNLTELTILNLNNNKFRGPIPETIGKLRKLTRLTLSENFFTGGIPQEIGELKKLQYLDLSANRLSGTIPSDMTGRLRSLTYLSLSNNNFSGRIQSLTGLWQLRTLDISFNEFFGNLPNLPVSLQNIYFSHNIFSGNITPLKDLIHLRWLDISDNRISGVIRWDTLSLKGVTHFNVSFNRFTSIDLVNNVGQGQRLRLLEAQGNNLKGHLPVNLVSFTNLTMINLSNNQYHGTIPKEYGTKLRTSWRRLYLDHNFLTGNLPLEFTHTSTYVKGSVANNCLKCPTNIVLCHGGQRPSTECMRQHEI
jgi:Leucine-rich repeat (LRR) protein